MEREAMERLVRWKSRRGHQPLVLRGARQVGKTWLMREFGRLRYPKTAYVNFEGNERMERLFGLDYDIQRILSGLRIETGIDIRAEDTLLVFDEVQEVPRALTCLKYFQENAPEYDILAAGSLLGIAMHPGASFPVGKVEFLDVGPLTFREFLLASDKPEYAGLLLPDPGTDSVFGTSIDGYLARYLVVGGMPAAVLAYWDGHSFAAARSVQRQILDAYEQDFSKHAPPEIVPRLRSLWQSVPAQLARENRKFLYGRIREGARAREYETAMQWLLDAGLLRRVSRVSKPGLPLASYRSPGAFKLYITDVGLLGAMSRLDPSVLLEGSAVFEEFKGALTEQYVLQQLQDGASYEPYYWTADAGNAEVDFVVQHGRGVCPIEVKAGENLQAKSLRVYRDRFAPPVCVRTSLSGFRREEWLVNLPLRSISALSAVLDAFPDAPSPVPGPAR